MREASYEGTIVKALSGFYYVQCGAERITCRARGKFRHQQIKPLVGDRVLFSQQVDGSGSVDDVLPRNNAFRRPAIANIDQMVLVASAAIPVTDPFLIDRMISIVEGRSCQTILCLNKWDLVEAQALYDIYTAAGFLVLPISAKTGFGIEPLRALLRGKISAFAGNSGVGKSSLLNALDSTLQIRVGEVSDKLGRGRHTTRHIELFPLGDGLIADTPGFSAFDADQMDPRPLSELADGFREFAPYLDACRFTDCAHVKEKGCAVLAALAEGSIQKTRHASYVRLWEEAKSCKKWK